MSKKEIKSALVSILIGALSIFLVNLLDGLLDFLKNHGAEIFGGGVAAWRHAIHSKIV